MSPPEHAYQSQLAYHQNQQYDFQGYTNPRNTQPHFFPQQSSQPQCFPQHSSQPQFKIPQAQEPREPKRKQKKTRKQPVVELDEGDENEDMETRRLNIRWNDKEEFLLAEAWIEHSQDNNIEKDQRDEIYWNKIIEDFHDRTTDKSYKREKEARLIETVKTVKLGRRVGKKFLYPHVWKILKEYPKWDAAEPIDGDITPKSFGRGIKESVPSGKQVSGKKTKIGFETVGNTLGKPIGVFIRHCFSRL
ncbi:hypothetical protein Tco_0892038 [Tanacetum coccineum]|uniref:Chromo domain-containing protein n=1 Tax=Tanacetum coccineum TaxID=301880 RepID=A0ABQ5C4P9_9ASTR